MRSCPRKDDRQEREQHPILACHPIQSYKSQIRKKSSTSTSFARTRKSSSMFSRAKSRQALKYVLAATTHTD